MDSSKKRSFIILLISVALLLSWLVPLTRSFWDFIDQKVYFFVNALLVFKPVAVVVGLLSQHITDFLFDIVMGLMFIWMLVKKKPGKALFFLLAAFTYELSSFYYINKRLIGKFLAYDRLSPTLVLSGGVNILDQISFGGVKTAAHFCFPGDHATTYFLWAFFMLAYGGRKYGGISFALASFFCLPRMMVGAHWFTDIFIGGLAVAALLLAFAMATGLIEKLASLFEWAVEKLVRKGKAKPKKEDLPPSK